MININKQQQLQELYLDWNELEAYRNLQSEPFDFGTGLITNDSSESEDVYWKIEQQCIDNCIDDLNYNYIYKRSHRYKKRLGQYDRKLLDQIKLKKLCNIAWMSVYYSDSKNRYIRCYRGSRSKFLKKLSNIKLRNYKYEIPLKCSGYRKVFDFWYELW